MVFFKWEKTSLQDIELVLYELLFEIHAKFLCVFTKISVKKPTCKIIF